MRAALGAGVARLRRLLLVENLLLAFSGAIIGVLIAVGGVGLLTSFAEQYSPRADEIRLDDVVLGFTVAVAATIAVLLSFFATLPREGRFASWMLAGAHRVSGSLRKQRLQRGLVVVQVAMSVILLTGATLLSRTMIRLAGVDTGLRTEKVLTMRVNLLTLEEILGSPAADAAAKQQYDRMRDEIAALAGVVGRQEPRRTSPLSSCLRPRFRMSSSLTRGAGARGRRGLYLNAVVRTLTEQTEARRCSPRPGSASDR